MAQFSACLGRYCTICITLLISFATLSDISAWSVQSAKVRLQEKYRVGDEYGVETTSELTGILQSPDPSGKAGESKPARKTGTAKSSYQERVVRINQEDLASKTVRRYKELAAQQTVGDQTQSAQLRTVIKKIILVRDTPQDVTFSPDGPMTLVELEQVRTDVFLPRLAGLFPAQPVGVNESWAAGAQAVQELTDLQQIQSGQLQCTLNKIEKSAGRTLAIVNLSGKVSGTSQQGPNQQTLQGKYHFDLDTQRLTFLQFEVTSVILDKNQKKIGDITARYRLVRELKPTSTIEVDSLDVEPTEENTLLLAQEPKLGAELTHSRRWASRPPGEKQWIIDGPSGSGLTIQFEPASNIPSAEAVRKEIEATLGKAAQGLKAEADPNGWIDGSRRVQRLSWRGAQNGKDYVFDYFLWKQGDQGAIIAARYFAPEAREAQSDAERIVRSMRVNKN